VKLKSNVHPKALLVRGGGRVRHIGFGDTTTPRPLCSDDRHAIWRYNDSDRVQQLPLCGRCRHRAEVGAEVLLLEEVW